MSILMRARQSSPGSFSESEDNSCGDLPRLLLRTQLCPVPRICVTALESRRDIERQLRARAQAWRESHLVLTTPLGTPVDPRNFHRAFIARCRKAGVPVTTVHATRKACASLLVALDVHPRVAMQILRHSQIAVTMDVCSQVTSDATSRALKRLGEELEGR